MTGIFLAAFTGGLLLTVIWKVSSVPMRAPEMAPRESGGN